MVSQKPKYWVMVGSVCVAAALGSAACQGARAAGPDGVDAPTLIQMEARAAQADPRERCYRYAEVLAGWTELEGRQIAAGEDEKARSTRLKMDEVAAKVHAASAGDAKRLKNAEQMLERATHRVSDMVHVVGAEQQAALQMTLQHMSSVHNDLLAMVFAH